MDTPEPETSSPADTMAVVCAELKELMRDMGVDLGAWALDGQEVEAWEPQCRFTDTLEQAGGAVRQACKRIARQVMATDGPAMGRTETGHCIIGVPVRRRRRLIAAAVGSFPTREMLDEEHMARLCDRLELDKQVLLEQAIGSVRHSLEQAGDFLTALEQALSGIQDRFTARQEIQSFTNNLATTYEELSLLYRITGSMHVTRRPEQFLRKVCEELLEVMNISASVAVVYAHPPAVEEDLLVVAGQLGLLADQIQDLLASQIAPRLATEGAAVLDNHFRGTSAYASEGPVTSFAAVPIVSDEETMGMLIGLNKRVGDFDSVDMKLITAIGEQISVFLTNNKLYADLQDLLMGVLHALTATIDAKDPYTSGHSQRVALISRRLAEECGFEPEKVEQIYLAGLLHDIGKIGVPEAILCKKGRLTDEEFEDMKRHPMLGANILGGIRQLDEMIAGILSHHERPDGAGYPRGLAGDEIPVEGRIICIADCFDAMSSYRTYRDALPLEKVICELRAYAGKQFDAELIEKFLSIDLEEFMEDIHQPAKTVFPFRTPKEQKR